MSVKVLDELDGSLLDEAWAVYHEAFEELTAHAVQRHLMYRSEFDEVMRDRRVQKYLCFGDGGEVTGLATYTNHLDAVPLISPQYFARRWPRLYAERRIWYIGFIAVGPTGRASALTEMVEGMYALVAAQNGIVGLDVCTYNAQGRHMARSISVFMRRLASNVQVERADEQSYWLYEFPPAA
jgi:hypothetical protein